LDFRFWIEVFGAAMLVPADFVLSPSTKMPSRNKFRERPLTPAFGHLSPQGREAVEFISQTIRRPYEIVREYSLSTSGQVVTGASLPLGERWPKAGVRDPIQNPKSKIQNPRVHPCAA
jgi:hypothetical protein